MTTPTLTFPQLLDRLAATSAGGVALQEKRYGIWQPITWSEYRRRVRSFAHGLASLGFERGEVLAILGDNRPEWLIAELAAQSLGGLSVGLYPDGIVEEVEHVLSHSGVRVVVAEDQEQVDKLLALRGQGRLDTVEWIVPYDPHGLEHYDDPVLLEFTELERRGAELEGERPGWLDDQVAQGEVGEPAILCTTSGTTAKPKLAVLTHANLLSMGAGLM
jgi:long-chain acyl-CoA synthetase